MVAKKKIDETDADPEKAPGGTCPECGGPQDASGRCQECNPETSSGGNPKKGNPGNPGKGNPKKGNPGNPGSVRTREADPKRDGAVQSLIKAINLSMATAQILYDAGFKTIDDIKKASIEDLEAIDGIDGEAARTIQKNASGAGAKGKSKKKSDDALKKWLTGESSEDGLTVWLGGDLTAKKGGGPEAAPAASDPTMDALKKWLTGEEDALTEWLGEEREEAGPGMEAAPTEELLELEKKLAAREEELKAAEKQFEKQRIETEKLKDTISAELENIQTGEFNPMRLIEESAQISRDLQTEIKRRKELEEDIEHIKKGTSAVVKYLKSQLLKGGGGAASKKKLAESELEKEKLRASLDASKSQIDDLAAELEKKIEDAPADVKEIKKRELALVEREAEIKAKEDELDSLEQAIKSGDIAIGGGGGSLTEEELQSRLAEELRQKENEFLKEEDELKKKIILLEEEIQKHKIEEKQREDSARLRGMEAPEIEEELLTKEKELQAKEKSILIREDEIQRLKEELQFKEDELQKLKEPLGYKEEEMLRREEDLLYREKLLIQEKRKLEEAKKAGFGVEEQDMKDRLEALKTEIQRKEDEVRAKEKYLKAKMEELRLREQGLIEEEIEAREEERALELQQDKIKTGTPRLDDLLLGGIPFTSNVQIYGPPFVGKEVIVNAFIAEGLKKGVPAIWVLTEKTPPEIREEMRFVVSGYEEYEKLGLVQYVDAYSKSMEAEEDDPYTTYVEDPTDHQGIMATVNKIAKDFKKDHDYYRLAFRSVSTLVAYLDVQTAFKFLQSFAGRRKRDKAVSFYMVEKGMHQDQEIQMMGSMMDGMIDLKVEQLKSYLSVQGVCDVQSRAWIKYTYSKHGVSIGSFSLDHIR